MNPIQLIRDLPPLVQIPTILALAGLGHLLVQMLKRVGESVLSPARSPGVTAREAFAQLHPKLATVMSLIVSGLTFVIYFGAVGLVLLELGVPLATYLTTGAVVGLAVGFGLQGLVQDVVMGLTLIFTDAFDIGEMIEVSGQVGRVERIGLRFTTLVNFQGQTVYVPNRNILLVSRFRRRALRAYVDVQIPGALSEEVVVDRVSQIALGMRSQFGAAIVTDPEVFGVRTAEGGAWRYVRLKFRLWPGQGALIETTFRQRVIAAIKELDPGFADWMVTVVYRVA